MTQKRLTQEQLNNLRDILKSMEAEDNEELIESLESEIERDYEGPAFPKALNNTEIPVGDEQEPDEDYDADDEEFDDDDYDYDDEDYEEDEDDEEEEDEPVVPAYNIRNEMSPATSDGRNPISYGELQDLYTAEAKRMVCGNVPFSVFSVVKNVRKVKYNFNIPYSGMWRDLAIDSVLRVTNSVGLPSTYTKLHEDGVIVPNTNVFFPGTSKAEYDKLVAEAQRPIAEDQTKHKNQQSPEDQPIINTEVIVAKAKKNLRNWLMSFLS